MRRAHEAFRVVKLREWWSHKKQNSHPKAPLSLLEEVPVSAENLVARKDNNKESQKSVPMINI